jgi:hypothetical protein
MWPFRTRPVVSPSDLSQSDQPLANRLSSDLTIAELFQLLGQRLSQSSRPAASPSSPPPRKLSARAIHVATRDRRLFLEQERARKQQQSRLQPPSE